MEFGSIPIEKAEGAILAHSVRLGDKLMKKGRALSAGDIAALRAGGVISVMAARLGPQDIGEDEAAHRVARRAGIAVQRARVVKQHGGVVVVEAEETCTVYGMPRAIAEAGLADHVVPLNRIHETIVQEAGR